MSAAEFAVEIDAALDEALEEFQTIIRTVALQGLQKLVVRTPVDTGRARGNWIVSTGTRTAETTPRLDPTGSATIADGNTVISAYRGADAGWPAIYVQNNLPYIERLESGSSKQAPNGMLALTFTELQAQFQ